MSFFTSIIPITENIRDAIRYTATTWPIPGKANKDNSVTILAALIPVIFADFFINSFLDISFFLYLLWDLS